MVIINSFKYPESTIRCQKEDVKLILDKRDLGIGTLYVSESTVCWHHREQDNYGLTINYPDITLHAISRDVAIYSGECVFIMVDGLIRMPGDPSSGQDESDNSDAGSLSDIADLVLVPPTTNDIKEIYEAIRVCQELNPDPNDMDEESGEEDDNLYEDAEDDMNEEERGGGDADIDDLSRRIRENLPDVHLNYVNGHNEEDEFQDAD